jgi:putative transcriptional regulator
MCLKDWRVSAGLTQRELARRARVARASISHVETGRFSPSPRLAGRLARALGEVLCAQLQTWDVFPDEFQPPPLQHFKVAA